MFRMNRENIFDFPSGLPGFETYHKYRLIVEEGKPLAQLISVEQEGIGFILLRPGIIFPDYIIEIDKESERILGVEQSEKHEKDEGGAIDKGENTGIEVWVILTLHEEMWKTTANLRAPIILNKEKMIGLQIILTDERYQLKAPIGSGNAENTIQEGTVG